MTRTRGITTKRIVFSVPIDLFNKIEYQIEADVSCRSTVYSRRLNYGVGCCDVGCPKFMDMLRSNVKYAKENPDKLKTVCVSVSDKLYADIIECAGDRKLSRFCHTLLGCTLCEHAGDDDLCKKEILNKRDYELSKQKPVEETYEESYVFSGKPILPKEAGNNE